MPIETMIEAVHSFLDTEVMLEQRRTEAGDITRESEAFEQASRKLGNAMRVAGNEPSEQLLIGEAEAYVAAATAFEAVRKFPAGGAEVAGPARRLERAQQSLQGVLNRCARETRGGLAGAAVHGKRILVAVDGSLPSQWAVEIAGRLALDLGAAIKLIHVKPVRVVEDVALAQLEADGDEAQVRGGELLLQESQLRLPRDLESSVLQPRGDAAVEIVGAARRWGADFVVVGTRGRGRVSRFLLGSTADAVVRLAPCPVITVSHAPSRLDLTEGHFVTAAEQNVLTSAL